MHEEPKFLKDKLENMNKNEMNTLLIAYSDSNISNK